LYAEALIEAIAKVNAKEEKERKKHVAEFEERRKGDAKCVKK